MTCVYDFSVNLNPLGIPDSVKRAIYDSLNEVDRYPDRECRGFIHQVSEYTGVPESMAVFGAGASELINRLVFAVRPVRAVLSEFTFSEYERALTAFGCAVTCVPTDGLCLSHRFCDYITDETDMVFICSPNNPTGIITDPSLLMDIVLRCKKTGTVPVIDESFAFFTDKAQPPRELLSLGAVIIRSLTKVFACPSVRMAYAVCSEEMAERLRMCAPAWCMSTAAQRAGEAGLRDAEFLGKTPVYTKQCREYLAEQLGQCGITVLSGEADFLLIKAERELYDRLLSNGILIRKCDNFRTTAENRQLFRIAVKNREITDRLIRAIRSF